jgi:hypothetical protein
MSGPAAETRDEEIAALHARVAELEAELAEQSRTTNALVASSQDRLYWYDRLGIDIERLMARPGAELLLTTVKRGRDLVRRLRKAKRNLSG